MPVFDFSCKACGHQFEAFVRKKEPVCPKCQSADLERLLSMPAVRTEGTKQKTRAQSKQQNDKPYRSEHVARLRRHHARTHAERQRSLSKYAHEHKMRVHRHRARMKARRAHHARAGK